MLSHDFLSIFELRICQIVVLELSSYLPPRVFFVSESLEALFPSLIILVVDDLVLFEIQFFRDGPPSIPILERELVAEAH